MKPVTRINVALSVWLLGLPPVVAAQDEPKGEIAGGYQYMWDSELEESFPAGWFISGAGHVASHLAIVGEVAGSHKRERAGDFEASFNLYTYLGGARVSLGTASSAVRPFVQLLAGAATARASVEAAGTRLEESQTKLAIQPGAGLDIGLSDSLAARVMVDYRRTFFEDADGNEVRLAVGIVARF